MPIFIAYDHNSIIIDIVLARNTDLAKSYWQGKGITPYTHTEVNENDLEGHITGVIPLLTTYKASVSELGGKPHERTFVKKGHS